jgi:hypothetical protein
MRSSHKPSVRFEAIAHKLAAEDDREFWQLASKIYVEYELTMAKLFKTEMTRAAAHGGLLAFSFFAGLFTLLLHAAGPPQSLNSATNGKAGSPILRSGIRPENFMGNSCSKVSRYCLQS